MKIVDNLWVRVRKLWNAVFGKNGDGSEIKLIKANPTTSESDPYLDGVEIDGVVFKVLANPETIQEFVLDYLEENPDAFEGAIAPLIAPVWNESTEYKGGSLFTYQGKQYYCIADAPAGTLPTNTTYFEEKSVADIIEMIKQGAITVGKSLLANNLDSNVVQNDVNAYTFRTAGGSLEIGDTCKEKAIVGGSLGWNQLIKISEDLSPVSDYEIVLNGSYNFQNLCTFKKVSGHRYFIKFYCSEQYTEYSEALIYLGDFKASNFAIQFLSGTEGIIETATSTNDLDSALRVTCYNGFEFTNADVKANIIDLDATFGKTITDYILSLGYATGGVAWFKRYFPKPYYPYTPIGGFTHVKTKGKKIVGFNLFNPNAIVAHTGIIASTGDEQNDDAYVATDFIETGNMQIYVNLYAKNSSSYGYACYDADKNYISGATFNGNAIIGLLTLPTNARYFRCSINKTNNPNYQTTGCINFHYDGERDGEYEEYTSDTYDCDPVELIGIPHIDEQGNLYFEGNRYLPSGVIEEEWAIVDLSQHTSDIYYASGQNCWEANLANMGLPIAKNAGNTGIPKVWWTNGSEVTYWYDSAKGDVGKITVRPSVGSLELGNGSTTIPPTGFVIYKRATTGTSSATPYQEIQKAHNWGTEEWLAPDDDTRPAMIPVGHDTDYPVDLKSKTEIMPDLPSDDGQYIVDVSSGTAEYIPLNAWLSANGYYKMQDLSNEITDILSDVGFQSKKMIKIGNVINLSLVFTNTTGATIDAGTTICKLPVYPNDVQRVASCVVNSQNAFCRIGLDGVLNFSSNIPDSSSTYIAISYIV